VRLAGRGEYINGRTKAADGLEVMFSIALWMMLLFMAYFERIRCLPSTPKTC
jgi:hypothetical protein